MAANTVRELTEQMQQRWDELTALSASPDMYGSELLHGQLAELELWLARTRQLGDVRRAA